MREITFGQAEFEAIDEEMARDPRVFILGESVQGFGFTPALAQKYGAARVIDTPISEKAIVSGAIGAAATGVRPIAFMLLCDFLGVCADELLNQLQMRYMFGGKIKLPITMIAGSGAGNSSAAQHSKTLYSWFMAAKGLMIAAPCTPYDAKGLLKSAIREDNPVLFLSHKMTDRMKGEVPEGEYTIPLGKADVKRPGKDVTVVAIAYTVHQALGAASRLEKEGISLEVIDLRCWVPLDRETVLSSVRKTGRLIVMIEEPKTGSAAAEISAIAAEEAFPSLKAPIKRVCAQDTPVPFSPVLEKFWMPSEEALIKAVREIV